MLVIPINQSTHWSVLIVLRPKLLLRNIPDGVDSVSGGSSGVGRDGVAKEGHDEADFEGDTQHHHQQQPQQQQQQGEGEGDEGGGGRKSQKVEEQEHACILCLDSLGMHNSKTLVSKIKGYLLEEYLHKKCGGDSTSKKYMLFEEAASDLAKNSVSMKGIPTQQNGAWRVLCIRVCLYAYCVSSGRQLPDLTCTIPLPLTYSPSFLPSRPGYDCGMYTIKYVQTMLRKWPCPTHTNLQRKFSNFFAGDDFFDEDQVTEERTRMTELLQSLKPGEFLTAATHAVCCFHCVCVCACV